ncbi:ABC transporter ATP-binding protein [Finegoldia magna]|uniref:Multidrug ABC transporter n=2 Tax=Finegoldia magna TaxID=1260 RepID=B0S170_FINM2|nr:ABC transporter ATP-binding protein [Finegoldia magna]MSB16483.1 ATP-binding cassette domain-containing protein [Finegoldia magna]MSD45136.1 ATP-binding cassette domain-containing protein [Finegoldia magna]UEA70527.1 ABC transporter ATP-binding protein/permease [Finegoldia magna]BAG08110.1 multidrug ABC transporter [Finegoldia magna ATCC 29328]
MYKKFYWFLKYYKNKLILAVTFLLLSDLVGLIPPYITGKLTDRVLNDSIKLKPFLIILLIDVLIIGIKYFFAMGWCYYTFRASNEIDYVTRNRLMDKYLNESMKYFQTFKTGELMNRATGDVNSLSDLMGFGTLTFFDSTVFPLFIIIIMMVVVDVRLTLVSIIPLPILAFLCLKIGRKIHEKYSIVQSTFDKLNNSVLEDVEGIRIIRVFGIKDARYFSFKNRSKMLVQKNMDVVKYRAMMAPFQRIIPAITFVIAIGYGSYLISKNVISVGQLVSFTYYLNMLIWPMYALGNFINVYQQADASMDRIDNILDYKDDLDLNEDYKKVSEIESVKFENYSFKYPYSEENALKDISFEIKKNMRVAIVGKTGSGKSTILKQFLFLYPRQDEFKINGKNTNLINLKSARDNIAYVSQKSMIFSDTIKNNIKLSKIDASDEEVVNASKSADIYKDIVNFPDGFDTLCGENGLSLSGGQKQRISIARALLKDSNLVVLDDCLSALDTQTEKNILRELKKLKKTVILSTHRLNQIDDFDLIIVLKDGHISEMGTHSELMENKQWYYTQYNIQLVRERYEE